MAVGQAVKSRGIERAAALCLIGAAVGLMLWPMQRAWFTVIDDHQIVGLAGADARVSAGEAAAGARRWLFEENGRVRPLFWALWHLEAWWAGLDPSWWHRDRLVLALMTAIALYFAAEAVLPPLLAALAAFAFFCGFQNEVFMRLKVQETYGAALTALGTAVLARGLARARPPAALSPGFLALGLAGLVKESFAPLLPAALFVSWLARAQEAGARRRCDRLAIAAFTLWAAALCGSVLWVRLRYGPAYGEPMTAASLAANAWRHLWLISKDSGWPLVVLAAAAALAQARAPREEWRTAAVWLLAGAALLLVPQWLVYSSGPLAARDLVPGCLFAAWAVALGLRLLRERSPVLLAAAVGVLVLLEGKWVVRDRGVAEARAAHTWDYRAAIEAVVEAKQRQPELEIVFRTEDPYDFEPVDSAWQFLAARLGPFRPVLLASDRRRSQPSAFMGEHLAGLLRARAEGREGAFRSASALPGDPSRCLEVTLRADPRGAVCDRQVSFPPPEPPDRRPRAPL